MDHIAIKSGHAKLILSGGHVPELESAAGADIRSTIHFVRRGEYND